MSLAGARGGRRRLAAEHFFGMLAGHRQYRALLGVAEPGRRSDDDRAAATVLASCALTRRDEPAAALRVNL